MTPADIAQVLSDGGVAVIPTDTVYGLAAVPRIRDAVERVFALKGRSETKGLPVLAADVASLETVARFEDEAADLARRFWPGPLTMVLPRAGGFAASLGGPSDGTVAVRVPDRHVTLEILRLTGPLAVTSANRSGAPPATTAAAAAAAFRAEIPVLDDGRLSGTVSTVLALAGRRRVLREGAIAADELVRG
ncbi:MAG: L-threonylcarbamoyladenylate synthase [Actinomycetota bacterium]